MILCITICVMFPCFAIRKSGGVAEEDEAVLHIWQIDSFEGGKGSRADFLQNIGSDFLKNGGCFTSVISLSADAARLNIENGNVPDVISYGAGMYGIEHIIDGYTTWCRGGYCVLTLDMNSDFSDMSIKNTIINSGKDNLSAAAALMCGVDGADTEKPTGAYVKLISGKYKYLLGTQRDIFRLKTRGLAFAVKPVTQFNDLYQNISVTSQSKNYEYAKSFISYLKSHTKDVVKLGLLTEQIGFYDDEMRSLEGKEFEYKLMAPISEETSDKLKNIILQGDINMLKELLK